MSRLQSEYSSIMSEETRRGFPLSADRIRYIVKLNDFDNVSIDQLILAENAPSRKTSDRTEKRFESFRHVMRNEVLVNCRRQSIQQSYRTAEDKMDRP